MNSDQQTWRRWASGLQSLGWQETAATLLETAGPLGILGAQIVYLCQPVLQLWMPDEHVEALGRILEDPESAQKFIELLKGNELL